MKHKQREGYTLYIVIVVLLIFSVLGVGLFRLQEMTSVEAVVNGQREQAFWLAEAGLQQVVSRLRTDVDFRNAVTIYEDSPDQLSRTMGAGAYSVEFWQDEDQGDGWFRVCSRGTFRGEERMLTLNLLLNTFGSRGLISLGGNSTIKSGAYIDGSIFQSGKLTASDDVVITGEVMASNYEDFTNGIPMIEDALPELDINTSYFDPYFLLAETGAVITNETLVLNGNTNAVVLSSPLAVTNIVGPGTVVISTPKQTFAKNLTVGDGVTLLVDGDLFVQKDAAFGQGVVVFVTGSADLMKDAGISFGEASSLLVLGDLVVKKELDFQGLIFAGGTVSVDKDLSITGSLISGGGYTLDKEASVIFDEGSIPSEVSEHMITYSFAIEASTWAEVSSL